MNQDWQIFKHNATEPHDHIQSLPPAPSWRSFTKRFPSELEAAAAQTDPVSVTELRGKTFQVRPQEAEMVNAALYLRRPLLVTGKPGIGKSSLAYAVAHQLQLGEVLSWSITTRTSLYDGLYSYDAIGRLQEAKQQEQNKPTQPLTSEQEIEQIKAIENYITLGALGTALLPTPQPRVLLIDEIDKSDIDLPNDLLTIFEEGWYRIPELERIKQKVSTVEVRTADLGKTASLTNGIVRCQEFPLVIMTSNGERDFPAPFLRRCLRLEMEPPSKADLARIIKAHFAEGSFDLDGQGEIQSPPMIKELIEAFDRKRRRGTLATDQLLNAIFMVTNSKDLVTDKDDLIERLLTDLDSVS